MTEHSPKRHTEEPFINDGPRDVLEGHYTQADDNTAETRAVHGRYTKETSDPASDSSRLGSSEGSYTGAPRTISERQGKFIRTEPRR
ncbi:hypothetical protein SAMN05216554_0025 [Herbiconiux ginsengi]|uniref:Uncharacterized protein n=1 Tax=Herbiconiux ginsengi TaxID=381665 RepID=A0A1H3U3H6_9MICO|nr:hypothetical protein SAMN05216554_0025 [Herbiconiux ginsengi]